MREEFQPVFDTLKKVLTKYEKRVAVEELKQLTPRASKISRPSPLASAVRWSAVTSISNFRAELEGGL